MIKVLTILYVILFASLSLKSQSISDTLIQYADRSNWGNAEMMGYTQGTNSESVYTINNEVVPKYMYDSNMTTTAKMVNSNGAFLVITYDLNDHIISTSLQRNNTIIGFYIEYYESGQCKISGQYCELNKDEIKISKNNSSNAKDKVWKYYNNKGFQIKEEVYIRGVLK